MSICHIGPVAVLKSSLSQHRPLYLVLTLLLGEMLDVARYGRHGCKLSLHVKVHTFDQPEQMRIRVLTVISFPFVLLTVHYELKVHICFM